MSGSQIRGVDNLSSSACVVQRSGRLLQRKCACGQHNMGEQCEECKKKQSTLDRRSSGSAPATSTFPSVVHEVLRSPGQPIEARTRGFMESRLGHDFSRVRVHSDAKAAQSARAVSAQAYTVGRDLVFDSGQYSPWTASGSALLAHELTHVMQQSHASPAGGQLSVAPANDPAEHEANAAAHLIRRPAGDQHFASALHRNVLQRQAKPGTSVFQEDVVSTSTPDPGVTEGIVHRQEFGDKRALLNDAYTTGIRFDENACKVTIPVKVSYREPAGSDFQFHIKKGEKPSALPKGKGREVFKRYISEVNKKLNGWFGVRLQNCEGAKCADKLIPIEVDVREDDRNPDYTVTAVNAEGRSYVQQKATPNGVGHVVLIHKGGLDESYTMAHEGAHMALAHGDEYAEVGQATERVREDDLSLLANSAEYQGWSQLHERHFAFIPAFLKSFVKSAAGKPCDATLQELRKPGGIHIRTDSSAGYTSFGGGGMYAGAGVSLGYLSGLQGGRFELGARFGFIQALDYRQRAAFLLGLRVGAEKRFTRRSGSGLRVGGFLEGGAISYGAWDKPAKLAPYAEAGATLGYGFSPGSGKVLSLFVEAAAGTTLDPHDPDNQKWFRTGVGVGLEF